MRIGQTVARSTSARIVSLHVIHVTYMIVQKVCPANEMSENEGENKGRNEGRNDEGGDRE